MKVENTQKRSQISIVLVNYISMPKSFKYQAQKGFIKTMKHQTKLKALEAFLTRKQHMEKLIIERKPARKRVMLQKTRLLINQSHIWRVAMNISCPNLGLYKGHILQVLGQNHMYHTFHDIQEQPKWLVTFVNQHKNSQKKTLNNYTPPKAKKKKTIAR